MMRPSSFCAWSLVCVNSLAVTRGIAQDRARAVEDLRFGSIDAGPYRFARVFGGCLLPDGSIVIAVFDGRDALVESFDPSGRHRWAHTFAGHPSLTGPSTSGDTVAVQTGDGELAEVHFLRASNGSLLRTVSVSGGRGENATLVPSQAGGFFVVVERSSVPAGPYLEPVAVRTYQVKRYSPGARGFELVSQWLDSTPRAIVTRPRGAGQLAVSLPWQPRLSVASTARGVFAARVAGYRLDVYGANGGFERLVEVAASSAPISQEVYDSWFHEWRLGLGRIVPDSEVARVRAITLPPHRPFIARLRASTTGLAVTRADLERNPVRPSDSVRVDIIADVSSAIRGQLTLPPGSDVLAFGDSTLLIALRDSSRTVPVVTEGASGGTPLTQIVRLRIAFLAGR